LPRVRWRASASIWRVAQANLAAGIHLAQDVLGIGRGQPLVEVQPGLPARLHQGQRVWGDACRQDGLDRVVRSVQQRAQRLV
jgi:hypothetical protein